MHVSSTITAKYPVTVASLGSLADSLAENQIPSGTAILVSDENVWNIHGEAVQYLARSYWDRVLTIVLEPGESMKSAEHLQTIYDRALGYGIDRESVVIALGGGVVGDLAGYAAATLLRGLPLVHIPTSLIAQVDSSIGGKTGINHAAGKNLVGAFHAPRLVHADPAFLATLPYREYASGMAEVVKHALIADAELAQWLLSHRDAVLSREPESLAEMLPRAISVKVAIVREDVLEHGRRALLNFGHTFGHAIEKVAGYGVFTHGEAVAVGMRAAVYLSERLRPDVRFDLAHDLIAMLPVEPRRDALDTEALMEAMQVDKKVHRGRLRFIVLEAIGQAEIASELPSELVRDAIAFAKTE